MVRGDSTPLPTPPCNRQGRGLRAPPLDFFRSWREARAPGVVGGTRDGKPGCQRRLGPPESALPSGGQGTAIGRQSVNRSGSSSGPMWIQGHPSPAGIIYKKNEPNAGARCSLLGAARSAELPSCRQNCSVRKNCPLTHSPLCKRAAVFVRQLRNSLAFYGICQTGLATTK